MQAATLREAGLDLRGADPIHPESGNVRPSRLSCGDHRLCKLVDDTSVP